MGPMEGTHNSTLGINTEFRTRQLALCGALKLCATSRAQEMPTQKQRYECCPIRDILGSDTMAETYLNISIGIEVFGMLRAYWLGNNIYLNDVIIQFDNKLPPK